MQRVQRELEASGTTTAAPISFARWRLPHPGTQPAVFEGKVFGTLVWPPRGTHGFGYDPIFVPEGYSETFGEMDPSEEERHVAPHARLRKADRRGL